MSAATQRIPVLVTPEEKEHIANLAREAGLSMGEFFRQAAAAYRPSEDAAFLEGMIAQINKSAAMAEAAVDETLAFVAASNERIVQMELRAARRPAD